MTSPDLRRGDRVVLEYSGIATGIVTRRWTDQNTGQDYIALRTAARDERTFRMSDIRCQEISSRDNDIPDRVTSRPGPPKKEKNG